ncbi:MAG: hypothetical protein R2830_04400 [Saprospiraceae bacterium]
MQLTNGTYWNDAANWSLGKVPQPCHHVVIPSGHNVILAAGKRGYGRALEVQLNCELMVEPMGVMDIKNN